MEEMPDDVEIIHMIHYVMVSGDIGVKPGPEPDLGNASAVKYEEGTLPGSNWTRRRLRKL
jgi:hypothetical protein